jgi:hypothetical protein
MLKGDSPGVSPTPNRDPALSAKVTTGGLIAPASRWKARCHLLWIDGSQSPVHAPVLGINVEEPCGSHYGRKTKDHFLARQWSLFPCLTFHSPQSNDKSYRLGQIWLAPRALFYLASGLLFERPPLLSFFPHSSWNSSDSAGMGFTISTKSSNSPPPRQLSLLPPPSGTNRFHSVDWWDECRVSLDSPPYSNKTQTSLTVSIPKNNVPSSLRDNEALCLSSIP